MRQTNKMLPGGDQEQSLDIQDQEETQDQPQVEEVVYFDEDTSKAIDEQAERAAEAIMDAISYATRDKVLKMLQGGSLGKTFTAKFSEVKIHYARQLKLNTNQVYELEGDADNPKYLPESLSTE